MGSAEVALRADYGAASGCLYLRHRYHSTDAFHAQAPRDAQDQAQIEQQAEAAANQIIEDREADRAVSSVRSELKRLDHWADYRRATEMLALFCLVWVIEGEITSDQVNHHG